MAGGGELGADLVGAAGEQLALHQGQAAGGLQGAVAGGGAPPAGDGMGEHLHLGPVLVLQQKALQRPPGRAHAAVDDGQVVFGDLPVPDLLVEHPQGLCVLGGHDDAAGVPVDAVAQGGGEGMLVPGVPLLLLIEVGLDVGDEGVDLLVLVGVAEQAGPLVQQQQVLVLVHDVQPGLEHGQEGVVLPGLVKELVVDV